MLDRLSSLSWRGLEVCLDAVTYALRCVFLLACLPLALVGYLYFRAGGDRAP